MTEPADRRPEPDAPLRPFLDAPWPADRRQAVAALWDWHGWLSNPAGADPAAIERDAAAVEREEAPRTVPPAVWEAAAAACRTHRLSFSLLASQLAASARLAGPVRFGTNEERRGFMDAWAVPHARLLARLADAAHGWQLDQVDALAHGFFLTGRLYALPRDLGRGRLFIPLEELERAGCSVESLLAGRMEEPVRRLLWRETLRARDAFGRARPLGGELERAFALAFRRWWLGALEWLHAFERSGFDPWRRPVRLSAAQRAQVRFRARFGRFQ